MKLSVFNAALKYFAFAAITGLFVLVNFNAAGQNSGFKVRGVWSGPDEFDTQPEADSLIARCQRAGINTLIPDVMYKNNVYFKSKNFKGNVVANDQYDPLGYLIKKAHAVGIKVQAWSCVYYITAPKEEMVGQTIDKDAAFGVLLTPAHPEVNPYIESVIKEMLAYDVDGIHLDYCRYWNAAFDYSEAARKGCRAKLGFDPLDFLDHPERIVPANKDRFPIRVLHPKTQIGKVVELGHTERNMNMTETGYAFVSESPKNIDALKTPGLLVIDYFNAVSPEMAAALDRYVNRGGNILWMTLSNDVLSSSPVVQKLTGLTGAGPLSKSRVSLEKVVNHPVSKYIPTFQFNTSGYVLNVSDASVLAKYATGEPAITVKKTGKSSVIVIGFNAMQCSRDPMIALMKGIMDWSRAEAGVKSKDLLAEKRQQWVKFREDQILPLVRNVYKDVKAKSPDLVLSSSAGVGPQQTYGIYRNGGDWLVENINDHLFPMNYTTDPVDLVDILDEQETHTPKGMKERIYSGIKLYTVRGGQTTSNDPEIIEKQLLLVQKNNYNGFCLFSAHNLTDGIIEVVKKFSK